MKPQLLHLLLLLVLALTASCGGQNGKETGISLATSLGPVTDFYGSERLIPDSDTTLLICRISERHARLRTGYITSLARDICYGNTIYLADNPKTLRDLSQTFGISEETIYATTACLSDADNQPSPYFLFTRGGRIKAIYIPSEANDGPDKEMISQMITSAAQ